MKLALKQAQLAGKKDEVPVGAVIVFKDEVVAAAYNLREKTQDPTNHAEIIVIKEAAKKLNSWRLDNCEIYVTKEPCPMCAGAIFQARIKKLIYGASDKKMGYSGTLHNVNQDDRLNWQTEVVSGILENECREILQDFFKKRRK